MFPAIGLVPVKDRSVPGTSVDAALNRLEIRSRHHHPQIPETQSKSVELAEAQNPQCRSASRGQTRLDAGGACYRAAPSRNHAQSL